MQNKHSAVNNSFLIVKFGLIFVYNFTKLK